MEEIWKKIEDTRYEISNLGRIRSYYPSKDKYKLLTTSTDNTKGYERISLSLGKRGCKFNASIHRLVAIAFIPNPENKLEVNHIDEVKTNNIVDNLEWVTSSENVIHSIEIWRDKAHCKPISQYSKDNALIATYKSLAEACRINNYDTGAICRCANGQIKKSYGFIWKYNEDIVQSSEKSEHIMELVDDYLI